MTKCFSFVLLAVIVTAIITMNFSPVKVKTNEVVVVDSLAVQVLRDSISYLNSCLDNIEPRVIVIETPVPGDTTVVIDTVRVYPVGRKIIDARFPFRFNLAGDDTLSFSVHNEVDVVVWTDSTRFLISDTIKVWIKELNFQQAKTVPVLADRGFGVYLGVDLGVSRIDAIVGNEIVRKNRINVLLNGILTYRRYYYGVGISGNTIRVGIGYKLF